MDLGLYSNDGLLEDYLDEPLEGPGRCALLLYIKSLDDAYSVSLLFLLLLTFYLFSYFLLTTIYISSSSAVS